MLNMTCVVQESYLYPPYGSIGRSVETLQGWRSQKPKCRLSEKSMMLNQNWAAGESCDHSNQKEFSEGMDIL